MKQCSACQMLFRAKVHKCPKCGSYAVVPFDKTSTNDTRATSPKGQSAIDPTRVKTKPRLRGHIVPQTPTPLQGERAISKELLESLRRDERDEPVEVEETPTQDGPLDQQRMALEELERALGDIGTDATVEVPNPLSAGLDFTSDVFLDDRMDPSIEGPMPELRRDPSVEEKRPKLPQPDGVDVESFGKVPTKPKAQAIGPAAEPAKPPPAPFVSPREQLEIEESIVAEALEGLDLSLRDPNAAMADPSLILDLEEALTEEEIELARSVVTGERAVRGTRRFYQQEAGSTIEVSPELQVVEPKPTVAPAAPPALPSPHARPPALPVGSTRAEPDMAPRIGSRLTGAAATLAFGGAAALALMGSATAVAGWVALAAALVVAAGAVRADLGWKHELLHVIAAGAAVAATQPWALDLAQIGQVAFWRAPAAMACVGALVVGLTLALVAMERGASVQTK